MFVESKRLNINSYYVKKHLKIAKKTKNSVSNGASSLYAAQSQEEIQEHLDFFNNFDDSNIYTISVEHLREYLISVKFEYIVNVVPNQDSKYFDEVSIDVWNDKINELAQLTNSQLSSDIRVEYYIATNPDRLYIKTNGTGFKFLRSIAIPDISEIVINKIDNQDGTYTFIFIPMLKENFSLYFLSNDIPTNIIPTENIGCNMIFYGAPGTGKSYEVDKRYNNDSHTTRITFHPEYTYHDFVGSYKPDPLYKVENPLPKFISSDNVEFIKGEPYINYKFVPGPFTLILEKALISNNDENHEMFTLIIEEINRANAAAVFGDLFQLLDRNNFGESEYGVSNLEILKYFKTKRIISEDVEEIKIPSNLNIVATMNSADQGVFVMDSAFKRRWNFEYIPINFDEAIHKDELVFYNNRRVTWNNFASSINELLSLHGINEDKHLGPYFIKEGEPSNVNLIVSKLLIYLWDDVAKTSSRKNLIFITDKFKTFSQIAEAYKNGENIFRTNFNFISEENEDSSEDLNNESVDIIHDEEN